MENIKLENLSIKELEDLSKRLVAEFRNRTLGEMRNFSVGDKVVFNHNSVDFEGTIIKKNIKSK